MSDENKDPSHYTPFYHDQTSGNPFSFFNHNHPIMYNNQPTSYMSSTHDGSLNHYNTLSSAFDMTCSSSEAICPINEFSKKSGGGGGGGSVVAELRDQNPLTPTHSSVSSSSTEGAAEKDSGKSKKDDPQHQKGCQEEDGDEDDKLIKSNKPKKKGEKRQRQPRFAFMTKTEIDNLEDGYRWRKYGQKAVKNSPFPRNYYRCTTQKCTVKKRVERSYEDPSTVITTYEGQHNHHSPATLRGNAAVMFPPPSLLQLGSSSVGPPSFPQQLLLAQMIPNISNQQDQLHPISSMYYHPQQQQLQFPDYGLLQDFVPSFTHKQEP